MNKITTLLLFPILLFAMLLTTPSESRSQDRGVLILSHGGSEQWNEAVIEAADPLKEEYRVEFAFGMANYVTLHHGLRSLEEQGVTSIAVIPLFISSHSPIIRQTEYLLGKRDSLADRPMPLMHHAEEFREMTGIAGSEIAGGRMYMPEELPRIALEAEVMIGDALDDHEVAAKILNSRIAELSSDPSTETVVLVAHGPGQESDNRMWLENMESLAGQIQMMQKEEGEPYRQIFSLTVRDDAPDPIFNQARENLRALVRQAGRRGEVIVVPLFLSSGGREHAVAERLEGLDFVWNGKTLLPDPLISDFLWKSVEDTFQGE